VIDVLSGEHNESLSLQPWHRRPLLATSRGHRPAPGRPPTDRALVRFESVAELRAGRTPEPETLRLLSEEGFAVFLLVDRDTTNETGRASVAVVNALDACCGPARYSDDEARVYVIPDGDAGQEHELP
jgi:hypothetical protein